MLLAIPGGLKELGIPEHFMRIGVTGKEGEWLPKGCASRTMAVLSKKNLDSRIKECQQLIIPDKIISCLKELLEETNSGLVAYELGREYEKIGNNVKAFQLYDLAEDLFEDPNSKNMVQAAINNLVIEEIISKKKRKK